MKNRSTQGINLYNPDGPRSAIEIIYLHASTSESPWYSRDPSCEPSVVNHASEGEREIKYGGWKIAVCRNARETNKKEKILWNFIAKHRLPWNNLLPSQPFVEFTYSYAFLPKVTCSQVNSPAKDFKAYKSCTFNSRSPCRRKLCFPFNGSSTAASRN